MSAAPLSMCDQNSIRCRVAGDPAPAGLLALPRPDQGGLELLLGLELLRLVKEGPNSIGITGGEPTLLGEGLLDVIRACRELGVGSVAIYSTADAESAAVRGAEGVAGGDLQRAKLAGPVAVHAFNGLVAALHDTLEEEPHFAQDLAAGEVAVGVVDALEMVEVDEQQRDRQAARACA